MKKTLLVLFLLGIICLTASGCQKSAGTRKIVVNETGVYVSATSQVMREEKILEKYLPEDVELEWSTIMSAPDIRDALLAGKAVITDFSLMSYITGIENDLPLRLLSFCGSTPINVYSNDAEVKTLADFAQGDRISVTNLGTNLHVAFLAGLERAQLLPSGGGGYWLV